MKTVILRYFPQRDESKDSFDNLLDLGLKLHKARNEMAPFNDPNIVPNKIKCNLLQHEFSIDAIIQQDKKDPFFFENYLTQFIEKAGAPRIIKARSDYDTCDKVLSKWKLRTQWSVFLGFYGKEVVPI